MPATLCQHCRKRPAVAHRGNRTNSFKHGRPMSRSDHDLCRQCWQANHDQNRPKVSRGRLDGLLDELMEAAGIEVRR